MQPFLCGRIHLQRRIEDEEQCRLLIRELQELIQLAFTQHIHDREVLEEDYIRRVLHFRKVKLGDTLNIVSLNDRQKMLKLFIISDQKHWSYGHTLF